MEEWCCWQPQELLTLWWESACQTCPSKVDKGLQEGGDLWRRAKQQSRSKSCPYCWIYHEAPKFPQPDQALWCLLSLIATVDAAGWLYSISKTTSQRPHIFKVPLQICTETLALSRAYVCEIHSLHGWHLCATMNPSDHSKSWKLFCGFTFLLLIFLWCTLTVPLVAFFRNN